MKTEGGKQLEENPASKIHIPPGVATPARPELPPEDTAGTPATPPQPPPEHAVEECAVLLVRPKYGKSAKIGRSPLKNVLRPASDADVLALCVEMLCTIFARGVVLALNEEEVQRMQMQEQMELEQAIADPNNRKGRKGISDFLRHGLKRA